MKSRRKWLAITLFVTVVINYLDRTNISVAAIELSRDLGLTRVETGLVFSAFAWSYSLCQIPGGIVADRVRPRTLYPALLVLWSVATLFQGLAGTFLVLIVCRVLIGVFEAPSYPINNRIVTSWFGKSERAGVIGFYTSGQYLGLAVLAPALFAFQAAFGWRALFFACGAIGIFWAWIFRTTYRDPDEGPATTEENREVLRNSGAIVEWQARDGAKPRGVPTRSEWAEVLQSRELWGIYLGQFCIGTVAIFFLTWFPTYLVESRGMSIDRVGFAAASPFLGALLGVLLSGFLSDWLVRRGVAPGLARKGPVLFGVALSASMLGAIGARSDAVVIAFMTLAFFGNGMASITWVFVSLLAPPGRAGLTGGVFNFVGGLSAAITPLVIGFLVDGRDFTSALVYVSCVGLVGIGLYILLVGRLDQREFGMAKGSG